MAAVALCPIREPTIGTQLSAGVGVDEQAGEQARAMAVVRPDDGPAHGRPAEAHAGADMRAAAEPPEARGLRRDGVRLLVSDLARDTIKHARFSDLPRLLSAGDLLVVNTSGTLNAALDVETDAGAALELHLSTQLPGGFWTVELRQLERVERLNRRDRADRVPHGQKASRDDQTDRAEPVDRSRAYAERPASLPYKDARAGLTLRLPGGGRAALLAPYPLAGDLAASSRLWMAALQLPASVPAYFGRHGFPIRYRYVTHPWPSAMYQTVFATEPGSAEMPSAGRPFTTELVTRLVSRGIQFAPILLHTGVASLEDHEPPYEEYYRVSPETAERVNATRRAGRRVIAVGTTAVRALETVTDARGTTHPGEGWTGLVIGPDRPLRVVDSIVSGLHEPRATHRAILEQVIARTTAPEPRTRSPLRTVADVRADVPAHVPREPGANAAPSPLSLPGHLARAYDEARRAGYLWHEFGDAHVILGSPGAPD